MATTSSNYSYVPYQVMDAGNTNLRATLLRYVQHWYWFLLSIGVMLSIAFVYLRYQQPTYKSQASLLVKDEKRGWTRRVCSKSWKFLRPKK